MKLYHYWRSSSSYRARIAFAIKGVAVDTEPVHLIRNGGEQHAPAFVALNPQARVPLLQLDDGRVLSQSMAIIGWLDAAYPEPPLVPADAYLAAQTRAFADVIASDAQPLHNSGVLQALESQFAADKEAKTRWVRGWVERACAALEAEARTLERPEGFLFADGPTLAEVCLVPHLYTARRWGVDVDAYPRLLAAEAACLAAPGVADAAPERQPEAARES